MSFGSWWVQTRNAVEAEIEALAIAMEPTAKQILVTEVQLAVAALNTTPGSLSDKAVAARNAVTASLQAQGVSIGTALISAAVSSELSSPTPSLAIPPAQPDPSP